MDFETIVAKMKAKWPQVEVPKVDAGEVFVIIPTEKCLEIMTWLKTEPDLYFDSMMSLAGVDTGRELWVVYPMHSMKHRHRLMVKVVMGRETPEVESIVSIFGVANFFEREAYDLYGIVFKNHPDLRRIINPPDWVGWPGRKDYEYPADYHGVPTLREDQFFSDAVEQGVSAREEEEKKLLEKLGLVEKK